jgi:single-strand DNA-binding protein
MNNIVLAGNVVKDPVTRQLTSGKSVTKIRLAVNNPINDKDTLYIDVDTWDKQSEFAQKHVKKGSAISIVGRLKQETWEKDGVERTTFVVSASQINFNGPKKADSMNGTSVVAASDPVKTAVVAATTASKPSKIVAANESEFDSLFTEAPKDQF